MTREELQKQHDDAVDQHYEVLRAQDKKRKEYAKKTQEEENNLIGKLDSLGLLADSDGNPKWIWDIPEEKIPKELLPEFNRAKFHELGLWPGPNQGLTEQDFKDFVNYGAPYNTQRIHNLLNTYDKNAVEEAILSAPPGPDVLLHGTVLGSDSYDGMNLSGRLPRIVSNTVDKHIQYVEKARDLDNQNITYVRQELPEGRWNFQSQISDRILQNEMELSSTTPERAIKLASVWPYELMHHHKLPADVALPLYKSLYPREGGMTSGWKQLNPNLSEDQILDLIKTAGGPKQSFQKALLNSFYPSQVKSFAYHSNTPASVLKTLALPKPEPFTPNMFMSRSEFHDSPSNPYGRSIRGTENALNIAETYGIPDPKSADFQNIKSGLMHAWEGLDKGLYDHEEGHVHGDVDELEVNPPDYRFTKGKIEQQILNYESGKPLTPDQHQALIETLQDAAKQIRIAQDLSYNWRLQSAKTRHDKLQTNIADRVDPQIREAAVSNPKLSREDVLDMVSNTDYTSIHNGAVSNPNVELEDLLALKKSSKFYGDKDQLNRFIKIHSPNYAVQAHNSGETLEENTEPFVHAAQRDARYSPPSKNTSLYLLDVPDFSTERVRQLRDRVKEMGGNVHNKLLGNLPPTIKPLLDSKGHLSADKLQSAIDSVPTTPYWVGVPQVWEGAQRHSVDRSLVFHVNYTDDHVKKMKEAGVWPTFLRVQSLVTDPRVNSHPLAPNTIGWVRYTGGSYVGKKPESENGRLAQDPESAGIHIDEAQSDLGQARLPEQFKQIGINLPTEHMDKIKEILWGKRKTAQDLLGEAFLHHHRQDPKNIGIPVHWSSYKLKLKQHAEPPQDTYNRLPKDLGFSPTGKYGDLVTQTNKKFQNLSLPTHTSKVRKSEEGPSIGMSPEEYEARKKDYEEHWKKRALDFEHKMGWSSGAPTPTPHWWDANFLEDEAENKINDNPELKKEFDRIRFHYTATPSAAGPAGIANLSDQDIKDFLLYQPGRLWLTRSLARHYPNQRVVDDAILSLPENSPHKKAKVAEILEEMLGQGAKAYSASSLFKYALDKNLNAWRKHQTHPYEISTSQIKEYLDRATPPQDKIDDIARMVPRPDILMHHPKVSPNVFMEWASDREWNKLHPGLTKEQVTTLVNGSGPRPRDPLELTFNQQKALASHPNASRAMLIRLAAPKPRPFDSTENDLTKEDFAKAPAIVNPVGEYVYRIQAILNDPEASPSSLLYGIQSLHRGVTDQFLKNSLPARSRANTLRKLIENDVSPFFNKQSLSKEGREAALETLRSSLKNLHLLQDELHKRHLKNAKAIHEVRQKELVEGVNRSAAKFAASNPNLPREDALDAFDFLINEAGGAVPRIFTNTVARGAIANPNLTIDDLKGLLKNKIHNVGTEGFTGDESPQGMIERLLAIHSPNQHNGSNELMRQLHVPDFSTERTRQLRDKIKSMGGTVHNRVLGNLPPAIKPLLDNKGHLTADKLQSAIDAVPTTPYWVGTPQKWDGGQQHSSEPSKVFHVNYTDDHVKKMKEAGVWPTFLRIQTMLSDPDLNNHPLSPSTIGWVRYTGGPDEVVPDPNVGGARFHGGREISGPKRPPEPIHIDEAQSDLGQARLEDQLPVIGFHPPMGHLDKIKEILWGKRKTAQDLLGEAFLHHVRQNPEHHDLPVHWPSYEIKEAQGAEPPQDTYKRLPKDLGFEPTGRYGDIPTQVTDELKNKPTHVSKVRKAEREDLVRAATTSLDDKLRKEKYQGNPNPMAGHCYVASEALYHLLGGKDGDWVPQNVKHEGDQHWYLKHKVTGEILDPTASQFKTPVPYIQGRGRGFMTAEPSARAKELIGRIQNKISKMRKAEGDRPLPPGLAEWHAGSKLVDHQNRPLKLYRGMRHTGGTKGYLDTESYTDSPDVASIYSATPEDDFTEAGFYSGANVYPVHIKMTNPLDLRPHGHQMSFGDYLRALKLGQPNGINNEEANKVLNYLVNREKGKVKAGAFNYEVYDEDGERISPEDDKFFSLTMHLSPLTDLRDDHQIMRTPQEVLENADNLHVDTFALVDAPRTKAVAQRLGHDGVIHDDIFNPPSKELLGIEPHKLKGVRPIGRDGVSHVTYRPFSPNQVKSPHNVGTFNPEESDILKSVDITKEVGDLAKGIGTALGLVGALAVSNLPGKVPKPAKLQHGAVTAAVQRAGIPKLPERWTDANLDERLKPIAHLESNYGLKMQHARHSGGEYHTAYGALGLKPITAHEEFKHNEGLQKKYGEIRDPATFTKKMKRDPRFYNALANALFQRLVNKHQHLHRAVYAWRHGTGAAHGATDDDVANDGYVLAYRNHAANAGLGKSAKSEDIW